MQKDPFKEKEKLSKTGKYPTTRLHKNEINSLVKLADHPDGVPEYAGLIDFNFGGLEHIEIAKGDVPDTVGIPIFKKNILTNLKDRDYEAFFHTHSRAKYPSDVDIWGSITIWEMGGKSKKARNLIILGDGTTILVSREDPEKFYNELIFKYKDEYDVSVKDEIKKLWDNAIKKTDSDMAKLLITEFPKNRGEYETKQTEFFTKNWKGELEKIGVTFEYVNLEKLDFPVKEKYVR